ncbi:MAG: DUF2793 domain-containing protein [Pseudomonadota bacterium]
MSERTTILALPLIQASQAQKHITHNEAIRTLDALVQPVVQDRNRTEPPAAPSDGDRHIVAAGATGAWLAKDGNIAVRQGNAWAFISPSDGWQCFDLDAGSAVTFVAGNWGPAGGTSTQLGLNTVADDTNRLAVSADATLLTHDGAGHQLKVNKADTADTNSLLFQTNWSGRAEMGCAGEDAFSVKVSPDGTAWQTAFAIDPATALMSGAAIQSDASDIGAAKLARADLTFGPGNALAPVSMDAGQPAGGLIERGTTADGTFVKFADGTMICHHILTLSHTAADTLTGQWTFPAAFDGGTSDVVQASVDGASAAALSVSVRELGATLTTMSGSGQTEVTQILSAASAGAFDAADTLDVRVTAIGRWA